MGKKCTSCGETKSFECFSKNKGRKDGLNGYCKSCHTDRRRKHYIDNKEKLIDLVVQRRHDLRKWFKDYKAGCSCIKCGFSHPAAIEFHHRDPSKKDRRVPLMVYAGLSKRAILNEIAKCDTLCANCHRILHYDTGYDITKLFGDE